MMAQTERADLVFTNAAVWTADPSQPEAQAVAIIKDRIVRVGSAEAVRSLIAPDTKIIDLGGKLLLPGFIENHTHFMTGCFQLQRVDLRFAATQEEFARRIGERAAHLRPEVYGSHVLEHFDYKDERIEVLREWFRVLKPGGTLYVSVPDLERLCRLYLQPGLLPTERFRVMRTIFVGHMDDYDYHMAGIDESYLGYCLQAAGFAEIRRVGSFGLFKDDSDGELFGMRISLDMVAARPA